MKLSDVILTPGTRANQPAANTVPVGTLYYVVDESSLERSNGVTWDTFAPSGGGGGGGGGSRIPNFSLRTVFGYYPSFTNTASITSIGPAVTSNGTASASVVGGNVVLTYTAPASTGAQAGGRTNSSNLVQAVLNPDITIILRAPSDMTNVRIWVGFTSATFANSDDLPDEGAAFRFSTVVGDTGWTPVTRDGATQNVGIPIGSAPVADTIYRLRVRTIDGGTVWRFSVDGSAEQSVSTNVPQPNENMGWGCRLFTATSASRNIGFLRAHLEFGEDFS